MGGGGLTDILVGRSKGGGGQVFVPRRRRRWGDADGVAGRAGIAAAALPAGGSGDGPAEGLHFTRCAGVSDLALESAKVPVWVGLGSNRISSPEDLCAPARPTIFKAGFYYYVPRKKRHGVSNVTG